MYIIFTIFKLKITYHKFFITAKWHELHRTVHQGLTLDLVPVILITPAFVTKIGIINLAHTSSFFKSTQGWIQKCRCKGLRVLPPLQNIKFLDKNYDSYFPWFCSTEGIWVYVRTLWLCQPNLKKCTPFHQIWPWGDRVAYLAPRLVRLVPTPMFTQLRY